METVVFICIAFNMLVIIISYVTIAKAKNSVRGLSAREVFEVLCDNTRVSADMVNDIRNEVIFTKHMVENRIEEFLKSQEKEFTDRTDLAMQTMAALHRQHENEIRWNEMCDRMWWPDLKYKTAVQELKDSADLEARNPATGR